MDKSEPYPPDEIGTDCMALLYLMYEKDEAYGRVATRYLSDEVGSFLVEIGRVRDITMNFDRYYPLYPRGGKSDVGTIILNTGKVVNNNMDLYEEFIKIEGVVTKMNSDFSVYMNSPESPVIEGMSCKRNDYLIDETIYHIEEVYMKNGKYYARCSYKDEFDGTTREEKIFAYYLEHTE